MRKIFGFSALAAASFAICAPAQAATFITITGSAGTFGNNLVTCGGPAPCAFSDTINFVTPVGFRLVSAVITNISNSKANNIDFGSVTLNGNAFTLSPTGAVEVGSLSDLMLAVGGFNTIQVNGMTGGAASYSGVLSFAAVPEPAAWLLMIAGVALVGGAMRRRKAATPSVKVSYA